MRGKETYTTTYNLPARQRGAYWRIPPAGARDRPSGAEVARSEFATPVAALWRADRRQRDTRERGRARAMERERRGERGCDKEGRGNTLAARKRDARRVLESGVELGGWLGDLVGTRKPGWEADGIVGEGEKDE